MDENSSEGGEINFNNEYQNVVNEDAIILENEDVKELDEP